MYSSVKDCDEYSGLEKRGRDYVFSGEKPLRRTGFNMDPTRRLELRTL